MCYLGPRPYTGLPRSPTEQEGALRGVAGRLDLIQDRAFAFDVFLHHGEGGVGVLTLETGSDVEATDFEIGPVYVGVATKFAYEAFVFRFEAEPA